jgi:hypothetical protein
MSALQFDAKAWVGQAIAARREPMAGVYLNTRTLGMSHDYEGLTPEQDLAARDLAQLGEGEVAAVIDHLVDTGRFRVVRHVYPSCRCYGRTTDLRCVAARRPPRGSCNPVSV